MTDNRIKRVEELCAILQGLTNDQLDLIERVANQFTQPYILTERLTSSDVVNDCLLTTFGDALRIHHCFSKEPLSKDRFEYAFERSSNLCGSDIQIHGIRQGRMGSTTTARKILQSYAVI